MKILVILLSLFAFNISNAETPVKKIDRSAQEAVDEAKKAGSIIVNKLRKNTNDSQDKSKEEDSKKKD